MSHKIVRMSYWLARAHSLFPVRSKLDCRADVGPQHSQRTSYVCSNSAGLP
jgi:hypothetical protein